MEKKVSLHEIKKVAREAEKKWLDDSSDHRLYRDVLVEALLDRFDISEKKGK